MKKILLALSLLTVLTACSGSSTTGGTAATVDKKDTYPIPEDKLVFDGTGVRGGKVVLPLEGNPKTFNPFLVEDLPTQTIMSTLYAGLLNLDLSKMEDVPTLAKSYTVSDDGLTYTFTIRHGLLWSDSQPFSVDDIMFSYKVATDPKILTGLKDSFRQSDGTFPVLTKISDDTIQFKLSEVNVLFSSVASSLPIIPEHTWKKTYEDGKFMNAMGLGTDPKTIPVMGAYTIDSFDTDQRVVFKRNPNYFRFDKNGTRLPYLDKIVRVITADFNATVVKFQNGEFDMLQLRPEHYDLIKRDEAKGGYTVSDLGASYLTYYFQFNMNTRVKKDGTPVVEAKKLNFFTNKLVRQALSYAINREGIVKTVFQGRATPLYNFTSPANKKWFNPNSKIYPFDLTKAAALLDEAGFKDSNGDGLREYNDGTPISFSVKTNSENASRIQIANLMKEDFRKLGIEMTLQPVPFNSLMTTLTDQFDFDAIIMGWGSGTPPDPVMSKNAILSSGRSHNWNPRQEKPATDWEAQIDALMTKNQGTLDQTQRQKAWFDILEIWSDQMPETFIATPNMYVAIKNKFANTKPVALPPYFEWNIDEVYDKTLAK